MAINLISNRIDELVRQLQSTPFTTHRLIDVLISNHSEDWEQLVRSYSGNRMVQEQKSVQQIGRYLGRYANRLGILQGETRNDSTINGLIGHNPQQTTEWQ